MEFVYVRAARRPQRVVCRVVIARAFPFRSVPRFHPCSFGGEAESRDDVNTSGRCSILELVTATVTDRYARATDVTDSWMLEG